MSVKTKLLNVFAQAKKNLRLAKFNSLSTSVINLGYPVSDRDPDSFAMLIDLGEKIGCLVTQLPGRVKLESSIVFDAKVINLKTMSTLAHLGMAHTVCVSGLFANGNKKVKILFYRDCPAAKVETALLEMKKCLLLSAAYVRHRSQQAESTKLDLSMFEGIDLSSFNPQSLGEKKEFIYRTWQDFLTEVVDDEVDEGAAAGIIAEIEACSEFEAKNKMLLAEVGDFVLDELYWYQHLMERQSNDGPLSVN